MSVIRSTFVRTLVAPSTLPVAFAAAALAFLGVLLARSALGGQEGFVDEVRHGSLLFAAALALSLAEPLEVGRDARGGPLLLRLVRGGRPALALRALGLVLATVPFVLVATWAGGALVPSQPVALVVEVFVLASGGLLLGAWFDRARLVPALWCLIVAGHLHPWLGEGFGRPVAWLLPELGGDVGAGALLHAGLWAAAALALAEARVLGVAGRGQGGS